MKHNAIKQTEESIGPLALCFQRASKTIGNSKSRDGNSVIWNLYGCNIDRLTGFYSN